MPNYNQAHSYYAGVDRHARSLFLHVLNARGKTVFEQDLPAQPDAFLDAVKPYRKNLVVGCECMFAWYWLADLCEAQRIPFVLGHALAMKHIHGGKAKGDKIDAGKLAAMLRGGMFPTAYVYPKAMRATRDLLRRRSYLVRQRAAKIDPDRLSFIATLRVLRSRLPECDTTSAAVFTAWYRRLLWEISTERLEPRRNRINPRVVKHQVSNYARKHPHHRPSPQLRKSFLETVIMLI
jgi:hypothetical protein